MPTFIPILKEIQTLLANNFGLLCFEKNLLGIKCRLQIRIMILIKKNVFEILAGNVNALLKLAAWTNRKCHAISYFKPIMVGNQSQYLAESSHLSELTHHNKNKISFEVSISVINNIKRM